MRSRFLFLLSFVFSNFLSAAPLPTDYLDWVPSGSSSFMVEPLSGLKTTGFTTAKPTFQNMNWNFNVTDRWIKYLKDERDSQASSILTMGNAITVITEDVDNLEGRMTTAEADITAIESTAFLNPMTLAGQTMYGGTAGAVTVLSAGTAGQIYSSNGASAPSWLSNLKLPSAAGTLSSPTYGWDGSSTNTGFFLVGTDSVGLTSNGTQSWVVDATGIHSIGISGSTSTQLINGQIGVVSSGSVTTPSFAFTGTSSNTGFYLSGTDAVGLSSNGVQSWNASSTGVITTGPATGAVAHPWRGSLDLTVGSSSGTPTYGMNRNAANALEFYTNSTIGLSLDSSQALTVGPAGGAVAHPIRGSLNLTVGSGTGTPAYGMNRNASNALDLYTNSGIGLSIDSSQGVTIGRNGASGPHHAYTVTSDIYSATAYNTEVFEIRNFKTTALSNSTLLGFSVTAGSATGSEWFVGNVANAGGNSSDFIFKSQSGASTWTETERISASGAVTFGNIHNIGSGNITSGRSTPTGTNGTNISASTPASNHYSRTGNTVTVAGTVTLTCTAGSTASPTASVYTFTLPIASNLTSGADLLGTGAKVVATGTNYAPVYISGDTAADRARFDFNCTGTAATDVGYTFMYEVK